MARPRLERRPEARAFTVETLLEYIKDGRIRIPDFQRPLRWRSAHVTELFDSIYRGFPVGELLLYKRSAEADRLHFGPCHIDAPAVADAYFLVDGQQRITALAGSMLHPDERPRGDVHAIWFDLEKEAFLRSEVAEPPPQWLPINVVGDSVQLLNWLKDWPFYEERQDLVQRAIALGKALREYQIPAYIIEGASEAVLRLVFKRVNTSGVAMQESEVFDALFRGQEQRPIDSACNRLQTETGFGKLSPELFLRCLEVVEGRGLGRTITEREDDAAGADPGAVERTEDALRLAIGFLSDDAGILHVDLLPYRLPLVVLARFFHLHPAPSPRTRTLLVRWVWRGVLSGVHSRSNDATVRDLRSQITDNESESVERLLGTVPTHFEQLPCASATWNSQAAKTRLCAIAMVHLRPRDPDTGAVLQRDQIQLLLDDKKLGNVFVSAAGKQTSDIAHRVLLPDRKKLPSLADAPAEVLQSHGLDAEAARALREDDARAFAERRAPLLDAWFRRFFAQRSALGESDRPAIAELIRRVDARAARS